jgi:regulatory protein
VLITKIVRSRKERNSYAVFIDEAPAFTVSDEVLLKFGLLTGKRIDERMVEEIASAEAFSRARKIAVNFISYRPRSSKEILDKLTHKGFSSELAKQVVRHLRDGNLVSDLEFARMLVRDKLRGKPMGRGMIRRKLLEKGISFPIIERVLKEYVSEDDEQQAAARLAAKKLNLSRSRFAGLDPKKQQKRLIDYLLSRGFSTEVALKTVRVMFS